MRIKNIPSSNPQKDSGDQAGGGQISSKPEQGEGQNAETKMGGDGTPLWLKKTRKLEDRLG